LLDPVHYRRHMCWREGASVEPPLAVLPLAVGSERENLCGTTKVPLVFEPQPEGGFTVTSPLVPELVTEGDSVEDALENVRDALAALIEAYQEMGRTLPPNLLEA